MSSNSNMKLFVALSSLLLAVSATTLCPIPDPPTDDYGTNRRGMKRKKGKNDKNDKEATYEPGSFSWGYYIRE
jgi:hypothetical protein